ncbi:Isoleucine--tRNA ligase, cytoplasmic, partial [Cichlidogyrus casuarinus]
MARASSLPASINFPSEEETILQLWKDKDAFHTSLKQSAKKPRYTFYDGPPFATGMPHYGHLLAGTIKDIITRSAHQSGFHVDRRFGWDCHGLPVEYEVDKQLGITGPQDVEKMGIAAYNDHCRSIVMRYSGQWEEVVNRIGRWIDFKHDYRTMYPWFMESVWWVFKQIFEKGLVYRGTKVMPFSTACATPLSNFEAGQNYKDVQDPAVVVAFPLIDTPDVSLIAWTTTPWTLPSNLALCVHPEKDYVKIEDLVRKQKLILMESRLSSLFKKAQEYKILEKFKGSTLKDKRYLPMFDYFKDSVSSGFRVLCDEYVTEDAGTGVVHQAPYFGEDDFRVCLTNGVITKDMPPVCPVDSAGRFMAQVTDFAGQYVKDADKAICLNIKQRNRLINQATVNHNYPFCWRSDTPLIYKAVPTWFIRVESLVGKLLKNNEQAHWVPDFVRDKRFANWLQDARDWAVSRNRYWGTPIPLWVSDDFEEVVCIGSIEELQRLSGVKVDDLHKEHVDKLTIPSRTGRGTLKRIPEVFDCWFESGSMPYAQLHYPFENSKQFEEGFPADFIAEGIDQTRGWFYTLLVISTALFDSNPFKNLIVNGIVLAEFVQFLDVPVQVSWSREQRELKSQ